MVVVLILVRI